MLARFRVVERMLPHKIEAHDVGDYSRAAGNDEGYLVKSEFANELLLRNCRAHKAISMVSSLGEILDDLAPCLSARGNDIGGEAYFSRRTYCANPPEWSYMLYSRNPSPCWRARCYTRSVKRREAQPLRANQLEI